MYLRELFLREDDRSTAVFAFGRFNPPTIGHKKLLDKVVSMTQQVNGKGYLFLSQKQNNKTDPLIFDEKQVYLKGSILNFVKREVLIYTEDIKICHRRIKLCDRLKPHRWISVT